jgi:hypothetical protein
MVATGFVIGKNIICNLTCNWKKPQLQPDLQLEKSQTAKKSRLQLDMQLEKISLATGRNLSCNATCN